MMEVVRSKKLNKNQTCPDFTGGNMDVHSSKQLVHDHGTHTS